MRRAARTARASHSARFMGNRERERSESSFGWWQTAGSQST
jgi:hypothetical protein